MRARILAAVALLSGAAVAMFLMSRGRAPADDWTATFRIESGELGPTGANPWLVLEPGYSLVLEDGSTRLEITVLDETRLVDGIETRVVEERETENGRLAEVSRNFFAISRRTGSVFYFGEEVDVYGEGGAIRHEGAWESGVNGARFGLMMPGVPLVHGRYYQEIATGVAMDRAEILGLDDTLTVAGGRLLRGLLRIEESSPLEPGVHESKMYAPGIGLVLDGSLRLVGNSRREATTAPPSSSGGAGPLSMQGRSSRRQAR